MKKVRKKQSPFKGMDDPFYKLMTIGGEAVLKLIGINHPDIVAFPLNDKHRDRVFIEFQGYKDTMI